MKNRVIVIGASHNGIGALTQLVESLPGDLPAALFIVLHVPANSPSILPQILARAGRLPATHARHGEQISAGRIYVAPPDRHMLLRDGTITLSDGPKENWSRPAIDPLFRSAAITYGPAAVGVILTGQLDDGTAGMLNIKDRGGVTIVQDPAEAAAPSMPASVLRYVEVDHQCTITAIAALIVRLANDAPGESRPFDDLMILEDRIAEGSFTVEDWKHLERMTVPAGLACPDCRSALYEIAEPRMLRFRCRAGHAFSAETALAAQKDARHDLLSAAFGTLIEEATLARRLCARPEYARDDATTSLLLDRAAKLEQRADEMRQWLREPGRTLAAVAQAF